MYLIHLPPGCISSGQQWYLSAWHPSLQGTCEVVNYISHVTIRLGPTTSDSIDRTIQESIYGTEMWELVIHMHTEETGGCILIMYVNGL
jgi:hypothetical protein